MTLRLKFALPLAAVALLLSSGASAATAYKTDLAKSSVTFSFMQAGARNEGKFGKYDVKLLFAPDQLAASKLDVDVAVTSLDTGDTDRDTTLRGVDLFNVAKFPKAHFTASKIAQVGPDRYEAAGKLTIRNVTKDITLPFSFKAGLMTGALTIKRLEYGVGQGEWKSTEWVGDDVNVKFSIKLL